MTQEEKQLLIKVLCELLPYEVICSCIDNNFTPESIDYKLVSVNLQDETVIGSNDVWNEEFHIEYVKPYLRPMSSMTNEEFGFLQERLPYDFTRIYSGKFDLINDIHLGNSISIDDMAFLLDCLNKCHLDYRGLIPMGLALEAPEDMYNNKTE